MSALSDNEIAACIQNANWGAGTSVSEAGQIKWLDTAIAICRAESGGDPNAVSNTHDYGIWQINRDAHPDLFSPGLVGVVDPVMGTKAAKTVYTAAGGWSPWSTYKSGAYRKHLGAGKNAYAWLKNTSQFEVAATMKSAQAKATSLSEGVSPGDVAGGILGAPLKAITSIPDAIMAAVSNVFDFVKKGFVVLGVWFLGMVLLLAGLWFIVKDTKVGKSVSQKAGQAADVAKLAALA